MIFNIEAIQKAKCNSDFTYEDGSLYGCPECSHGWVKESVIAATEQAAAIRDSVTVIKDLKVKGTSLVMKVDTKVKSIRIVAGDHDVDCKIEGIGAMQLKSEFVKKA